MDPVTSIVGLVVVLSAAAWALARLVHVDGSNGTFLRFHPDLGWPHGVQEDDDVHWRWERDPALRLLQPAAASAARRPPVAPIEAAPLRLEPAAAVDAPADARAEIVETEVRPVTVARVQRRH